MSLVLIVIGTLLSAASGLPGLCLKRSSPAGQRIAVFFMTCSAILALTGAILSLLGAPKQECFFPWPALGNALIGIDALSAFFLIPVFLMGGLGSIYSLGYWSPVRHPGNTRKLHLFWGLLVCGLSLLLISRHAMSFLLGWEIMALSAFFLVATEDHRIESRKASWLYMIATHIGTLTLFALFALWRWTSDSYLFDPLTGQKAHWGLLYMLFFLALISFGLKAGMMPLHFWLPSAHASAPSHVSAMLSGIVLKMGIYGLLRFLSLLPDPPAAWGGLILALGAVSGLLGVLFAIGQHDLKRLLAYHSVENIGIILMGLGLAMLGRSAHNPALIVLGFAGCLLHVWNHSLFKSLLFFTAGSVIHHTHTREIDRMGGLGKSMPWTAAMFLIGAVAICGLPPLNGFVSEFFVYLGILNSAVSDTHSSTATMIAAPVLAMIGALAVACFVKVFGTVFLGLPRTHAAHHSGESPLSMRLPMVVLVVCCTTIGLAPNLLVPILDRVIACCLPQENAISQSLASLAPLSMLSIMSISLLVFITLLAAAMLFGTQVSASRVGTWDCGYARPTSRMQYTASSFAKSIVSLFHLVLRSREHRKKVIGLFPAPTAMHTHVNDVVLDRMLLPGTEIGMRYLSWFRRFQQGLTQHYVLYILITVLVMLVTLIPFEDLFSMLFAQ